MRFSTALLFVLAVLAALPTPAQAQFIEPDFQGPAIRPCPAETKPAEYRTWPVWGPDQVAVAPVVPEFLREVSRGRDPRLLLSQIMTGEPLSEDSEEQAWILRGHFRLRVYNRIAGFTPPGTAITDIPPLPEWFEQAWRAAAQVENLVWDTIPCWEPIHYLTSAGPDRLIDGVMTPTVSFPPQPQHLLGWYEEGIFTPDGIPAVRALRTKEPIKLKEGPNAGAVYTFWFIVRCGNPDNQIIVPPVDVIVEEEEPVMPVPIPLPPPPAPVAPALTDLRFFKSCQDLNGKEVRNGARFVFRAEDITTNRLLATARVRCNSAGIFTGLPADARVRLSEDPPPARWTQLTEPRILNLAVELPAPEQLTFTNQLLVVERRRICGPMGFYCWGPPVVAMVIWKAAPAIAPADRPAIDEERRKPGGPGGSP